MDRIEKLKEFMKVDPGDSFVQHALALEYVKNGQETEALQVFKQLLERDENYIGSYYHLAKLLLKTGQKEQALICYEKGMRMANLKGDQHAYNELMAAYDDLID